MSVGLVVGLCNLLVMVDGGGDRFRGGKMRKAGIHRAGADEEENLVGALNAMTKAESEFMSTTPNDPSSPTAAFIFGVSHSPWTQCAVITCEAKGIPYCLSSDLFSVPCWREVTAKNGLILPTLVLFEADGGKVLRVVGGSFQIMRTLDEIVPGRFPLGLAGCNEAEQEAALLHEHGKLEELFFEGAFERFYPLPRKLIAFPLLFARQPNGAPAATLTQQLRGAICKAFLMLHFGSFLCLGALSFHLCGHPRIADDNAVAAALDYWEARMPESGEEHEGDSTGDPASYLDLALFAQLQMVFTGLSPNLAKAVKERPRFEAFVGRMNRALPSYAATNYCRAAFEGEIGLLRAAPPLEVFVTVAFSGFLLSPLGLPLLLSFLLWLHYLRRRKAEASGKKLNPESYWGKAFAFMDLGVLEKLKCIVLKDFSGLSRLTERRGRRRRGGITGRRGAATATAPQSNIKDKGD